MLLVPLRWSNQVQATVHRHRFPAQLSNRQPSAWQSRLRSSALQPCLWFHVLLLRCWTLALPGLWRGLALVDGLLFNLLRFTVLVAGHLPDLKKVFALSLNFQAAHLIFSACRVDPPNCLFSPGRPPEVTCCPQFCGCPPGILVWTLFVFCFCGFLDPSYFIPPPTLVGLVFWFLLLGMGLFWNAGSLSLSLWSHPCVINFSLTDVF